MKAPAFQFYPGDFLSSQTVQLMETRYKQALVRALGDLVLSMPDAAAPRT